MSGAIGWGGRVGLGVGVVVVILLSLTPAAELPLHPNIWDKAQHFLAYGVLGFCGAIGFPRPMPLRRVAGGLVLLGGLLEVGQIFVAGRQGSVGDAVANGLGVAAGIALVLLVRAVHLRTVRPQ